ncbi:hypothetical protein CV102_14235 [Natronococcus pandeyae]|uniref:Uncharacterized protein n=1 Tax=Natronococcus pandeyae TaxID=2055836 RepID=A0A8J8TRM8_9EURY|nr:hypothetical protein [Natronococcus pandeyae]TYL37884.1 hypothetical protein CV102_14235 [Natronococcus pandeyae]
MTTSIKLYGMKADRFEQIKADLTVQLGYEPSNPEVIGLLMASFDEDELPGVVERSDRSVESRLLDDPEN